jgi:hypothetical protein
MTARHTALTITGDLSIVVHACFPFLSLALEAIVVSKLRATVTFTVTIIVVAVLGAASVQISLDIAFGRFTIVTAAGCVAC